MILNIFAIVVVLDQSFNLHPIKLMYYKLVAYALIFIFKHLKGVYIYHSPYETQDTFTKGT